MLCSERLTIFVDELWAWYARHKRVLPWRDMDIADPSQKAYRVLVSEMMLQQTQVSRVETAFHSFIQRFPSLADLASASDGDILRQWRGMGYNSRALRLRDAARTVMTEHDGVFPSGLEELRAIKGIGRYTAGAIRNFAFDVATACVDTNVRRVLHRVFVGAERADGAWEKDDDFLYALAQQALEVAIARAPKGMERPAAEWHAALMDFGSLVCTARSPKWDVCPITAKGACLAAYKVVPRVRKARKAEPGRAVGGVHIPNRIFRGRIVEELRDAPKGLMSPEIGRRISVDWDPDEHTAWLEGVLAGLERDGMVVRKHTHYMLPA